MRTERARLTLATRETILSRLSKEIQDSQSLEELKANKGGICLDLEPTPDIKDGDIIHWYGLITNLDSLLTSITSVFISFKRDYIMYSDTGNEETSVMKLIEIIIDFDGIEVNNSLKEAIQNLAYMLLGEYNPRVA